MIKRLFILLLLSFFMCSFAYAVEAEYERNKDYRVYETKGFHIFAADDDLSTSATLLTELDTTYAQLAAEDQIEVLSSSSSDTTQTVTVVGIDNSGDKISEDFTLTGTTVALSAATFRYIDQVSVDIECAGVITVQRETDTFIISIPIGQLNGQVSQHFNGEDVTYVTYWACGVNTTTGNVTFELRHYKDDADCLDSSDGFITLDTIYIDKTVTSPYNVVHNYSLPIKLPAGGWLGVWAKAGTDDADGYTILQGYDSSRYE